MSHGAPHQLHELWGRWPAPGCVHTAEAVNTSTTASFPLEDCAQARA